MTEGLTKWCEVKATKDTTAKTASKFLLEDVIHRFGIPSIVITDNGSHFRGEFHELCERMGINHRYATAYHPQTNGQDERTNGLLLGRIRKWRLEEYNKWDEDLTSSVYSCNTRKVSSTGFSPMEALMGFTAGMASSVKHLKMSKAEIREKLQLLTTADSVPEGLLAARLEMLEALREEVIRVKDASALEMKKRYDQKVRIVEFEIGNKVLLFDSTLLKQWSRKLEERWIGPYTVTWKGSMGAYTIVDAEGKAKLVSGDQLKRYYERS